MKINAEVQSMMNERFGHDTLLSVATVEAGQPHVRMVNAYYTEGCFYTITHAHSGKMRQIENDPRLAVCGEWFTAHGIGENMGSIVREENTVLMERLRTAFASWYGNGHVNESDPNMIILRIRLTDGLLFSHGTRYEIDF